MMSEPSTETFDIDQLCAEFEAARKLGSQPVAESCLERVSGDQHQALLVELLQIEFFWRVKAGDSLDLTEYRSRFPDLSSVVDVAWEHYETGSEVDATIDLPNDKSTKRSLARQTAKRHVPYKLLPCIGKGAWAKSGWRNNKRRLLGSSLSNSFAAVWTAIRLSPEQESRSLCLKEVIAVESITCDRVVAVCFFSLV